MEEQFALSSVQILDIINGRNRLAVAVRGGVAEYHLETFLNADPALLGVQRLDVDAMHDFDVVRADGSLLGIECKNVSPNRTKDGSFKVEVQKTRASRGDPASRLYRADAFDVVAACLFSATREWTFRFQLTAALPRHREHAAGRVVFLARCRIVEEGRSALLGRWAGRSPVQRPPCSWSVERSVLAFEPSAAAKPAVSSADWREASYAALV